MGLKIAIFPESRQNGGLGKFLFCSPGSAIGLQIGADQPDRLVRLVCTRPCVRGWDCETASGAGLASDRDNADGRPSYPMNGLIVPP